MEKKTVTDSKGKKLPADSANAGGAAYAPHDQAAEKLSERGTEPPRPGENAGDERTREKTIGEIKYENK